MIFTSDNGPHQEGGHQHEFFDSTGPRTGYTRSLHDGGIRVPMIARWPGRVAAGTTSDLPSAFWDFLPTACELAGVEPPDNIDGISYLPTLLGEPARQQKHEYLYWASQEGRQPVGVRHGKWKLVSYGRPKNAPKAEEDWRLYDLTKDIGETNDIAAEHPAIVEKILGLLERDGLR